MKNESSNLGFVRRYFDAVARFGVFMELRDGKILSQHNYDCFDPF